MRPRTLLVNPPLWNVYAPHLAVPLLAGVLGQRDWPVTALDLSIESIDWLLSRDGLEEVGGLIEGRLRGGEMDAGLERAALLVERAAERVDGAKATLRSLDGLFALDDFRRAKVDLRNAMWCVSAGFRDLRFDLVVNDGCYDKESTRSVLAAVSDPVDNLYRWLFERHLVPRLADPDLGLVGISASADTQLIAAMTVARLVREHRPDVHIVMGGNFTTRLVTKFRERHPFFDLVDSFVCYEGEDALPLLCQRQFEGGVACVPGLAEARAGEVVVAPPADVDLGCLPSADFSDLPLDRYFSPAPVIPTFASRSCAWKCAFCSIPFASNRFRTRKAEAVVDEIEDHKRRYGARHFMFVDEIMTIRSLHEVSRELVERGTDVHWYGETRFAPNLTPALAERIHASGCRRLNLGLESHSQRVLDLMRKGTDVSYIDANVEALLGAGVPIHLFVIFGFPGETPEEAQATSAYVGDVMDRARRVHGVPYATWGGSAFTLDLHSPVANEPDTFGVRIRPAPAHRDLALQLDYDVVHGRRQSTGMGMMSSVYAPGETGGGWVFRWVEKDVEEHLFLRGALNAPVADAVQSDPVPLPRLGDTTCLRLAPDVAWRRCALSITGRLPGPCIALYAPSSDALVEFPDLPAPAGRLATGVTGGQLRGALVGGAGLNEEEAAAWVRSLVRFRFLVAVAPGERTLSWHDAQLYEEAGTELCFDEAAETGTVTSTVTGRAVRLNLAGLALWLRCRDGNREATPARLLATYPDASRPAAERLLLTLIDSGLVGLMEADPDLVERPRVSAGSATG